MVQRSQVVRKKEQDKGKGKGHRVMNMGRGAWLENWLPILGKVLSMETCINYSYFVRYIGLSLCLTKHHAMKTYWGVEV
jgi:hypothetical protein